LAQAGVKDWALRNTATTGYAVLNNGSANVVEVNDTPASDNTCLAIFVNDGGAVTEARQVSMGADDSGGAGYKLLRVPN
jgi:hypothetical protein